MREDPGRKLSQIESSGRHARQLLTALGRIDPMTWRDQLRYLGNFFRQTRYRRKDHPLAALLDISRAFAQAVADEERRTRGGWWARLQGR